MSVDGFCAPSRLPGQSEPGRAAALTWSAKFQPRCHRRLHPVHCFRRGPSGFTGGYCTGLAVTLARRGGDTDCSADGGAQCFRIGNNDTACFQMCPQPGSGRSTCRADYTCTAYGLADGGRSVDGTCDPACNAVGAPSCPMGQTCNMSTGYCTP